MFIRARGITVEVVDLLFALDLIGKDWPIRLSFVKLIACWWSQWDGATARMKSSLPTNGLLLCTKLGSKHDVTSELVTFRMFESDRNWKSIDGKHEWRWKCNELKKRKKWKRWKMIKNYLEKASLDQNWVA